MTLLGNFREGIDKIRFHLKANKPLIPGSVKMKVTLPLSAQVSLPVTPATDTDSIPANEFTAGDLNTTGGQHLGVGSTEFSGKDNQGHLASRTDQVKIISSYGRNYGLDYGNGY